MIESWLTFEERIAVYRKRRPHRGIFFDRDTCHIDRAPCLEVIQDLIYDGYQRCDRSGRRSDDRLGDLACILQPRRILCGAQNDLSQLTTKLVPKRAISILDILSIFHLPERRCPCLIRPSYAVVDV